LVRVWILDKAGTVRASTVEEEVGTQLAITEPTCQLCHAVQVEKDSVTAFYHDTSGRELLRTATLVENEPECYGCHQPADAINGLVVVDFSVSDLRRQVLADSQEMLLLSAAAVALAALAGWLVLRRTVLARLEGMVKTTRLLGSGDLDQRVPKSGHDEIDELAGSLNAMAVALQTRARELSQAREEIAQKAAELEVLLDRMVHIQEEERGRIAYDMHDNLIQLLAGALLESQAALERLPADSQAAAMHVAVVQRLLGQIEEEVRKTIHDLHPPPLDLTGLMPAIKRYARSYKQACGISCLVEVQGTPRPLPSHVAVAVYRVVREALVNARTHSGARQVRVLLDYRPSSLRVMIADDGRGFNAEQALAEPGEHLGLIGMRERASSLHGHLEIRSVLGQGTVVEVEVPLEPQEG
jgi:signal transduction histidine kinase